MKVDKNLIEEVLLKLSDKKVNKALNTFKAVENTRHSLRMDFDGFEFSSDRGHCRHKVSIKKKDVLRFEEYEDGYLLDVEDNGGDLAFVLDLVAKKELTGIDCNLILCSDGVFFELEHNSRGFIKRDMENGEAVEFLSYGAVYDIYAQNRNERVEDNLVIIEEG